MATKTQKATLNKTKDCKHSVRYDDAAKEPNVLSSVYLLRPAYEALGQPASIEVEVKCPTA